MDERMKYCEVSPHDFQAPGFPEQTHSRLQPASSTNSKRTKSRTCNVTDSTAFSQQKNEDILCSFQERNK